MTPSRTIAPKLSQEPGTSADEWARETEGAIDQHSPKKVVTNVDRNDIETSRYEPPGAFPMASTQASPTSTHPLESAKQSVQGAYMTASHGVEGVYATAEHAARQYLPTSVVDKLEGVGVLKENSRSQEKPFLPTQESESNFTPTHGGVGSLPGSTKENRSNKSISKPSLLSTTTSTSQSTTTDPPDSAPSPTNLSYSPQDPHTAPSVSSNTVSFIPQHPASDAAKPNDFESANSPEKVSTPSSPVSLTGTLTSPDSDAQAATRACQGAPGAYEDFPAGSQPVGQLITAAQLKVNGGTDTSTDRGEGTPARLIVSPNDGAPTVKNGNPSPVDQAVGKGGKEEGSINEKGGHTRKSLFVQKLKGEAKAFADKVKTKTRG